MSDACSLQPGNKGGLPKTMQSIMIGCGSGFLFDMHTAVLTSYCVEVVTETPNCETCTLPPHDGSQGYDGFRGSWSEYMSCNNGNQPQDSRCYCEGTADRQIGHQTSANVKAHCPNQPNTATAEIDASRPGWLRRAYAQQLGFSGARRVGGGKPPPPVANRNNSDCECSAQEMGDSRQFTGRNPIPLPWTWQAGGPTQHDVPYGNWYSSPRESECEIGTPFGTKPKGCTWQQTPQSWLM